MTALLAESDDMMSGSRLYTGALVRVRIRVRVRVRVRVRLTLALA